MQYVRYNGRAHQRVITPADWRTIGVSDGQMVVWNAQNGFALPLEMFTEKQVAKAFDIDPAFTITAEDDEWEPVTRPFSMTPAELSHSIKHPVDVVALMNGDLDPSAAVSLPSEIPAPNGNVRPGSGAWTDTDARGESA